MNIELQYQDLLKELVKKSNEQIRTDRTGTGTYSVFGRQLRHNMQVGFPLLTTKKMSFSQIKSELLWFMNGKTDLRYLLERKNYIWVGDAYKYYQNDFSLLNQSVLTKKEFIDKIINDDDFNEEYGDLGPIYGHQWRNLYAVDQLKDLVYSLKNNPYSRRQIVSSWNVQQIEEMTLPPCHVLYQVYVEDMSNQEKKKYPGFEKKLSLQWYQRSVDTFLGLPFNIASYGMLLEILSKLTGYLPWELIVSTGDTHLYSNHVEPARIQISREPFELPKLIFSSELDFSDLDSFLETYKEDSIQLDEYFSHSILKGELSN